MSSQRNQTTAGGRTSVHHNTTLILGTTTTITNSATGTSTAQQNVMNNIYPTQSQGTSTQHAQPAAQYHCRATQVYPKFGLLLPGEPCAIDVEFQTYKHEDWPTWRHRIGRITIVNSALEPALDVYAFYPRQDKVKKNVPPERFGIIVEDLLLCNGAQAAAKVERWTKELIRDRTVIVHGGKHDLSAFIFEPDVFAKSTIVDTQVIYGHLQTRDYTPGLRTTAERILGVSVQQMGHHTSIEDAQTTMKLYDREAEKARIEAERAAGAEAERVARAAEQVRRWGQQAGRGRGPGGQEYQGQWRVGQSRAGNGGHGYAN
ncbi:uncharacterized protein LTR77_009837 [Saxophila tyrrhenica]|uniref:Exonuclease domain-containing protein n=1 Tax=Saxophila tyrrhenica TaxID=1690608 RepID=A0AAV9NXF4_9PEZI|nr:hypothetical protein LTR77_009837 [Saxophila tyrrhenica]